MTVDTPSIARELRAADIDGSQAEAIAAAIGRAVFETSATKADLAAFRSELKADLEGFRSSMLLWFIGTQVAVGALIVALVKL